MRFLKTAIHSDLANIDLTSSDIKKFQRNTARGVILDGENILVLYTERYHDYTLPGGGLNEGEEQIQGLIRELEEETGACNIRDIKPYGVYEEYRPWYKQPYDVVHMNSYCYVCTIDANFNDTRLEEHEIKNGMKPMWVNIFDAIKHNEDTMNFSSKKGMSIERDTFLLKLIASELLPVTTA